MDIVNIGGYNLRNLNKINILLGKNGCGKSTLLKTVESSLDKNIWGNTKYITPERGGSLSYEAGIEQNLINIPTWMAETRRKNQFNQFRQQSVAQFRKLKELILEEIESDQQKRLDLSYKFDIYINKLNSLLDNVFLKKERPHFKIFLKKNAQEIFPDAISSGESELISLGIECLIFEKESTQIKKNMLFLDEPDVHLHPDLQVRLMEFLKDLVSKGSFSVLIATHSTAILGATYDFNYTSIAFMGFDQKNIDFQPISETHRKILPVFGAHPLSNLFNEVPVFLVEGEDDERIWQKAVRTSVGKIKLYPCSCDGISQLKDFETEVVNIVNAVYDQAKAYSLRDRDDTTEEIIDLPSLKRFILSCRNAENLLLTNEVLESLSITWDTVKERIEKWIKDEVNKAHGHYQRFIEFKESGYDRKKFDLKEIRNTLMGIIESSKPWEIAVGQQIGMLYWNDHTDFAKDGSLYDYLGEKLVKNIIPKS